MKLQARREARSSRERRSRTSLAAAASCLCLLSFPAKTDAAAAIALAPVATGLANPVAITNAHDGSGRLFITLQDGRVMVHDGCVVLATPFLDIRPLVLSGGERGLLSVAFHPSFPSTPYFYVYYTRQFPINDGAIVIARYRVSTGNPNVADPTSAAVLLMIPHPTNTNHNGGQLQFGPDGYLYIGTGDGGSANDPPCNAQNDGVLLGKILRIDVNQSFNASPFYGIPPTNPVFGAGPRDEKWAKGVRNPWRFSFDRSTGDLLIADVGQNTREEVDFQPAGAAGGQNWGWRMMEGTICTPGTDNVGCQAGTPACGDASLLLPIFDYDHSSGRCSITGGYRYRGSQVPGLAGTYVYGDFCSGGIFQATESGGVWTSGVSTPFASGLSISTFGEDEVGELYVANHTASGTVFRIVTPGPQADLSITKTDGVTTAVAGQAVTYTIAVSNAGPATANAATVMDTFPAALQNVNWTCSASSGSTCCSIVGGNTLINRPVTVLPGGTVTYTATATISPSATGSVSNTATVAAPAGVTDPVGANNSATDTDTLLTPVDLAITKSDGQATASPGQTVVYTITASNAGPPVANGATVTDTVPAALTGVTWTCTPSAGASCAPSGVGSINDTVNLPVGGSVTYALAGTVAANPTSLRNTATVSVPPGLGDTNPANNSATDDDLLLCFGETVVVPDGRVTTGTIGAGATAWFAASLKAGNSYSLELKNPAGTTVPGTLTVFSGDDGCSGTSTLVVTDTTTVDPGAGAVSRRVSFAAAGTETFFRARLVNAAGSPIPVSFTWSDTTMYSPAWSTNGTFNTFYSFQNTTTASLNGTLTLLDTAGAVLSTVMVPIPAGQTVATNTQALGSARNRTGTARFTHDGPPGAVVAEAAIANFAISPAYVQPVKFQAVREAR